MIRKLFSRNTNNYKKFKGQEYFYTDNFNNLYFKSFHTGNFELVKDVDLKSLTFLSNFYFYDKERVFHESKCLKKDYTTFKDYQSYGYFKIDNILFWFGEKVKEDFTDDLINISEHFFTDNKHLFVNGHMFDFDIKTFKILNRYYAKDSNIVFHSDQIIDSADPETFSVIREDSGYTQAFLNKYNFLTDDGFSAWACDKNNLYFSGKPFLAELIDPLTTRIIRTHILIDNYSVYYFEKQIKDADPDTFECIIDFSKINHEYREIEFFTSFFKDKDNIFYLYEDKLSESKNEIIKCTRSNRKKYIDDLIVITKNIGIYNLTEIEIDRIHKLAKE
jgi:hypothetical protein